MKINLTMVIAASITLALVSLLVLVGLFQIDRLILGGLYDFGLTFSNRWAMPYWTYSGIIMGLSWVNIGAASIITYNIFKHRKRAPQVVEATMQVQREDEAQPKLAEYFKTLDNTQTPGATSIPESVHATNWCRYDVRNPPYIVDSQC